MAVPSKRYTNQEKLLKNTLKVKTGDVLGFHHPTQSKKIAFLSKRFTTSQVASNNSLKVFRTFMFKNLKDDVLPIQIEIPASSELRKADQYYNFQLQAIMDRKGMY